MIFVNRENRNFLSHTYFYRISILPNKKTWAIKNLKEMKGEGHESLTSYKNGGKFGNEMWRKSKNTAAQT